MTKEQKVEMYSMYLDGCTYQEIGDKFGVSRQYVYKLLSKPLTNKRGRPTKLSELCVYEGLSRFIKDNSVGCDEIARIIQHSITNTRQKITDERQFNISEIYKILQHTGMTFEECFKLKERRERQ